MYSNQKYKVGIKQKKYLICSCLITSLLFITTLIIVVYFRIVQGIIFIYDPQKDSKYQVINIHYQLRDFYFPSADFKFYPSEKSDDLLLSSWEAVSKVAEPFNRKSLQLHWEENSQVLEQFLKQLDIKVIKEATDKISFYKDDIQINNLFFYPILHNNSDYKYISSVSKAVYGYGILNKQNNLYDLKFDYVLQPVAVGCVLGNESQDSKLQCSSELSKTFILDKRIKLEYSKSEITTWELLHKYNSYLNERFWEDNLEIYLRFFYQFSLLGSKFSIGRVLVQKPENPSAIKIVLNPKYESLLKKFKIDTEVIHYSINEVVVDQNQENLVKKNKIYADINFKFNNQVKKIVVQIWTDKK